MVVQRALAGATKIERGVSTKFKQNEVVEGCTEEVQSSSSIEIMAPETELALKQTALTSAPREVEAKQQGAWDRRCFCLIR